MVYQVLARKYRPQRFDDIVGQRGVTQTLRNAITTNRLAQAFIFAGPRGVGKTTTARILARALNCEKGPTPDPCGHCDACVEIAQGRDIDVLEIDAATHTQVENVREVIIAGLPMAPVRDRFKIFIIDEFHQLSSHSFNALLKSIEEPPAHVMFMMATTELRKIPETILSRSQVYELRTIGTDAIVKQLRAIADLEKIKIDDASLALIARSADGSMRDAESALDQVMAFAGDTIGVDDVSTVLGLIGRDPVLDVIDLVSKEDPKPIFELAAHFVGSGYDFRLVCRELARAVRDLLVISIDPSRADDPEISGDAERSRLIELAGRFSREDLMRAFDVLTQAEREIRGAAQPRYHFEMAVLKWIHLRKLVPLTALLEGASVRLSQSSVGPAVPIEQPAEPRKVIEPPRESFLPDKTSDSSPSSSTKASSAPLPEPSLVASATADSPSRNGGVPEILAAVKGAKKFFHGTVVAQAQSIDLDGDKLIFTFMPGQRTLASQLRQNRGWLEQMASKVIGRKILVTTDEKKGDPEMQSRSLTEKSVEQEQLREKTMKDPFVQSMLEVFPAEIGKIEKLD